MVEDGLTQTLLVSAVLLLSIAAAGAQSSQNRGVLSSHSNSSKTETAARDLTLQGCIGGHQRYTFMQAGTGVMFQLRGRDPRFAAIGRHPNLSHLHPSRSGESLRL